MMIVSILKMTKEAVQRIKSLEERRDLEAIRLEFLGPEGKLVAIMGELKGLSHHDRKEVGIAINTSKHAIENEIEKKLSELSEEIW